MLRLIQDEIRFRGSIWVISPVGEESLSKAGFVSNFQEARWYDLVCIHITLRERYDSGSHCGKLRHIISVAAG